MSLSKLKSIKKLDVSSKLSFKRKEDNSKRFNEKKMHQLGVILASPQKSLQVRSFEYP